jgi:ribosomal protein S18 acetylase RimI-like enzyme
MTLLCAMSPETFESYKRSSAAGYAEDNVAAGRWPAEGAFERSLAEFGALLPQGLATPGNHVFDIQAGEGGPAVGALWFAEQQRGGLRSAYVYDLVVYPPYRRQGHARRAFEALEPRVRALGLDRIGLHVFGHNPGAQALYAQLGYGVTGINMAKQLGPAAA